MNYDQALAIAKQHAPELIVDPPYPDLPNLFAVRKSADGSPFSIHLHTTPTPEELFAQETRHLTDALAAAIKHLK